MATTTEIEPGTTPGPQLLNGEPPKRGPGRPPGSKTRNGRTPPPPIEDEGADNPPVTARTRADKDLWLELANYKPADWDRTIAYLYRVAPTIDRRSGGRPINIRKYAGPFDKDRIMLDEGSGVYRIDILRVDEVTGEYRRLVKEYFDILNMDYPPRVPAGDWIDDPANEVWKWAGPKLVAQQQQQNGGNMYPPGFSMDKVYDKAFDMAKAMAPAPKDDTALTALVTKLIDVSLNRPEPPKADDTATKALLSFLEKQNDRLAEELKELRKNPAPQPKGILEQMKELKPVIAEAVELFTQKNGGDQPWWAAPLEKLMEGVGEAIPSVVDMMKAGQQQQRGQAQVWNGPVPQIPGPNGIPVPASQPAAPPPPQGTPPAATAAATPDQPEMTDDQKRIQMVYQQWGGFVIFISPQMVEQFKLDKDGHGGLYFRDWFLRMHGELKWADLRKVLGPQGLAQMIGQHPVLSQEMMPEQERLRFFGEFFEPEEDEEEDEAEDDGIIDLSGEQQPQSKNTGTAKRDRGSIYSGGGEDDAA